MIGILQMSISATVLIMLILVVRALFLDRLPKRTFKILWAVVITRMLMPFSLPILPHYQTDNSVNAEVSNPTGYALISQKESRDLAQYNDKKISRTDEIDENVHIIIETVWICGAATVLGFFVLSHRRFSKSYNAALPCKNNLIVSMVNSFDVKRKINIRISDEISSPLTYGVINPTILLPERMSCLSRSELEYVLAHEIIHIKKNDVVYKWLLTLAVCVHWFNPLAWVMLVMANRDIELVCDEAVLKERDDVRRDYALTLIKMEEKRMPAFCVGFGSNSVKERIVTIMKFKKTTIVGIVASICLVAGSMVAFASENNDSNVDSKEQKTVQQIDSSSAESENEIDSTADENADKETITSFVVGESDDSDISEFDFEFTEGDDTGSYDIMHQFGEVYDIGADLEKYGIIADDNGRYTYNGKDIAGLIIDSDDGVIIINTSDEGVYVKVSESGAEELSKEEFESMFEVDEDENGNVTYSTEVEVEVDG